MREREIVGSDETSILSSSSILLWLITSPIVFSVFWLFVSSKLKKIRYALESKLGTEDIYRGKDDHR